MGSITLSLNDRGEQMTLVLPKLRSSLQDPKCKDTYLHWRTLLLDALDVLELKHLLLKPEDQRHIRREDVRASKQLRLLILSSIPPGLSAKMTNLGWNPETLKAGQLWHAIKYYFEDMYGYYLEDGPTPRPSPSIFLNPEPTTPTLGPRREDPTSRPVLSPGSCKDQNSELERYERMHTESQKELRFPAEAHKKSPSSYIEQDKENANPRISIKGKDSTPSTARRAKADGAPFEDARSTLSRPFEDARTRQSTGTNTRFFNAPSRGPSTPSPAGRDIPRRFPAKVGDASSASTNFLDESTLINRTSSTTDSSASLFRAPPIRRLPTRRRRDTTTDRDRIPSSTTPDSGIIRREVTEGIVNPPQRRRPRRPDASDSRPGRLSGRARRSRGSPLKMMQREDTKEFCLINSAGEIVVNMAGPKGT
ncbi:hypothetical protein MKZ38_000311 [Zalerion maritima]|uniref:Uncharacterized protein n=1 Tax=Zalerion maritima TaxID=339359 RepID=A0AAD5RSV4_9PEZI|nr:hypothetical protein MKZ38_000311 [Zalerion maritima]